MTNWVFILEQQYTNRLDRFVFGPYPTEQSAIAAKQSPAVLAMKDDGQGVEVGWIVVPLLPTGDIHESD